LNQKNFLMLKSNLMIILFLNKECGVQVLKPNMQQVRIIGGYKALPMTWPWTVSIGMYRTNRQFKSASEM
jgi:hypothetical protein